MYNTICPYVLTFALCFLGLGFRPMPPYEKVESTLVWYRQGDHAGNWDTWVKRLDDHLKRKYHHLSLSPLDKIQYNKSDT